MVSYQLDKRILCLLLCLPSIILGASLAGEFYSPPTAEWGCSPSSTTWHKRREASGGEEDLPCQAEHPLDCTATNWQSHRSKEGTNGDWALPFCSGRANGHESPIVSVSGVTLEHCGTDSSSGVSVTTVHRHTWPLSAASSFLPRPAQVTCGH